MMLLAEDAPACRRPCVRVRADCSAAGWRGAEPSDDGRTWVEAGPGRVRALTGGIIAVRRAQALTALPEDAVYGRHADLRLSLALPGDLVVPHGHAPVLPLHPHDVPGDYADRESRRNYEEVLRGPHAS